jgi:thiamine pyrophosphokinase
MQALILADGDVPARAILDAAWPGWDMDIGHVVAADGGARHAATLGVAIDLWVGDGDSLGEDALAALAATGVPIERSRADKDESDTELAIRAALRRDPDGLVVVGALGGRRLDHALANIGLLTLPDLGGRPVVILDARSRIGWLLAPRPDGGEATWPLAGRAGDLVTLLPMAHGVDGVTTDGLVYPLRDEPLEVGSTRGLSNVIERTGARVTIRSGALLIVETPATLRA